MKIWDLKEFRLFIYCLIAMLCIGGIWVAYVYYSGILPNTVKHWSPPCIVFSQNVTNESWKLTVESVENGARVEHYYCSNVHYFLYNTSMGIFNSNLSDIRNKPCPEYNITWFDRDGDYKVSVGDEFIISKTGGINGKVKQNDKFVLVAVDIGSALNEEEIFQ